MYSALVEPQDGGNIMEGLIVIAIWFAILIGFVALIILCIDYAVEVEEEECPLGKDCEFKDKDK